MENSNFIISEASPKLFNVWIDPSVNTDGIDLRNFGLKHVSQDENADFEISRNHEKILLQYRKSILVNLPDLKQNLIFILKHISTISSQNSRVLNWHKKELIDLIEIVQPALSNDSSKSIVFREFLYHLSTTISLQSALESIFRLKEFTEFSVSLLLLHQKGESEAWQIHAGDTRISNTKKIKLSAFNLLHSSVKKSKNGHFSTQLPKWDWLPFNGVFLAETFAFKNFNAIWITSRQEFLPCSKIEIESFEKFSKVLRLFLENLIELEFSDLRSSEIMWILDKLPFPLAIRDVQQLCIFNNVKSSGYNFESFNWFPISKGYEVGIFLSEDINSNNIDVFHRHKISLLGDLFNTLRHELSNPLFGLSLTCDLVLGSELDDESSLILSEVSKNIKRSQLIIQNLSRLYSDVKLDTNCNIIEAINESLTLAKSELKAIKTRIEHAFGTEVTFVEGKPVVIIQILFNLIINSAQALKNIKEVPSINIKILSDESYIKVIISDNGHGLPSIIKDNIFKPFHTTKTKGHGLGLTLSRDLAKKAGGDLKYIDSPVGATFELKLKRIPV